MRVKKKTFAEEFENGKNISKLDREKLNFIRRTFCTKQHSDRFTRFVIANTIRLFHL